MKVYFLVLLLLPVLSFALTVTDDAGNRVSLVKPAKRVISLAPDITEILFALGAKENLVGVIAGSDYPPAALRLTRVGSYAGLDLERILRLKPDLIISWDTNFIRQLAWLKKQGIAIYITKPVQLMDVAKSMRQLGILLAQETNAQQVASDYQAQLVALAAQYQQRKPITVFYKIGDSTITINKGSWINQAITLCGGKNSFAEASLAAPEINMEALIRANPDVIIHSGLDNAWCLRFKEWPNLQAVQHQALYNIDPNLIERAGPRLTQGVQNVCQILQAVREKRDRDMPHIPLKSCYFSYNKAIGEIKNYTYFNIFYKNNRLVVKNSFLVLKS